MDELDVEEARPAGSVFDPALWLQSIYQKCGRKALLKCVRKRRHQVRLVLGLVLAAHIFGLVWLSRTLVKENTLPALGPERDAFLANLSPEARHAAGMKQLPSTSAAPRHGWLLDWAAVPTEPPLAMAPAADPGTAAGRDDAFMVPPQKELPRLPRGFEEAAKAAVASGTVPPFPKHKVRHFKAPAKAGAFGAASSAEAKAWAGGDQARGALPPPGPEAFDAAAAPAAAALAVLPQASVAVPNVAGGGGALPDVRAAPGSLGPAASGAQSAAGPSGTSAPSAPAGVAQQRDPVAALQFGVR